MCRIAIWSPFVSLGVILLSGPPLFLSHLQGTALRYLVFAAGRIS